MLPQQQNPTPRKRYLDRADAHGLRPRFIAGETLEELAEWLAERRKVPLEQALNFLKRVRTEECWIAERETHLRALDTLVRQRDLETRAAAIMSTQNAIGERLIMRGLDEINSIPAVSRSEALRTLKMGYEFRYRSANLPAAVTDPSILPPVAEADERAASFAQITDAEFSAEVAKRLAAFVPIAGLITAAVQERSERQPEVIVIDADDADEDQF